MSLVASLFVAGLLHMVQSASTSDEVSERLARAASALGAGDLVSAQRDFEHAAALAADIPAPFLGLCEVSEQRGELFEALELCRKAERLAPAEPLPALKVGRLLARIGAVTEALEALARASRLDPNEASAYILSALLLRDAWRHKEAIAVLERGLAHGVQRPELSEELSFLLLSLGDRARAGEVARSALGRYPDHAGLKMALGLALVTTSERREESVGLLAESLELGAPDAARVHLELGKALIDLGREEEALEHLREAVRLLPDSAEAHYRLGTALRANGDLVGAQEELERFQALRQTRDQYELVAKSLRVDLNEAQKLAFENRLGESLDHLEVVLRSHPGEARAHALRAKVLSSLGRTAEALESVVRARELEPQAVEYHYLEGRFLVTLGRIVEAAGPLRRAIALDATLAAAYELLGVVAANDGRHGEAIDHYRRALEQGADTATLHLNLAEALRNLGQVEESEKELEAYRRLSNP